MSLQTRVSIIRPGPGQRVQAVLLGGLSDLKLHWVSNRTLPCCESGQCPYCPGRPDKISYRWYGAAALFAEETRHPTSAEESQWRLRKLAGDNPPPLRTVRIHTITSLALAEIHDADISSLGDADRRGLVVEWSKGPARNSKVTVKVAGRWSGTLIDEFDWLPAAERILNGGQPIRFAEVIEDQQILQFRRQA